MNCSDCASLCCIAPRITTERMNQGRGPVHIMKEHNTRCLYLTDIWNCSIHSSRPISLNACVLYTCKWFWPLLTEHLRDGNHLRDDGTLDEYWLRLYRILDGMLLLSFWTPDFQDAIDYYKNHKTWPEWMLTLEYWDYLFWRWLIRTNPRKKSTEAAESLRRKVIRIVAWFF